MQFRRGWALVAALLGTGVFAAAHSLQEMPRLQLRSAAAVVQDQATGELLYDKRSEEKLPIASITKLMTAMVVLDGHADLNEPITILEEDKDMLRHSRSRLPVGTTLTRGEAMLLALMSSENRAAHALGRTNPGGLAAFVAAMNAKAASLGLANTHFEDPAGLSSGNVASARDLARIVDQAHHYEKIRECTTTEEATIQGRRAPLTFHNTDRLLKNPRWHIGLSKTGFIDEAGRCLVLQAELKQRPTVIVLLDSDGRFSRFGDADRIRQWLEGSDPVVKRVVAKRAAPVHKVRLRKPRHRHQV
jgi:D-alanyl-D-alanine endopeptidase (penicillin-binding protein 7)